MAASSSEMRSTRVERLADGVWRVRFGVPEPFTPHALRERPPAWDRLARLPPAPPLPFRLQDIACDVRPARTVVRVPADPPEASVYGFGLDPGAFQQQGLRKWLAVSAQVIGRTGASHGPVPFYVSTRGYGVYVDTARVPFVHVGRLVPAPAAGSPAAGPEAPAAGGGAPARHVVFDLPGNSSGVDVFVFGGPTLREAVQRFNLFAGGGCLPPMWGLGLKYRAHSHADQQEVGRLARSFRDRDVPCDMLGLEPGWQTHAYSCSLVWSLERFPEPDALVGELAAAGFRLNLWEHAYIHPSSPLWAALRDRCGDYLVWDGLVVDFADPEAARRFGDYHAERFVERGVTGFKCDECDRQEIRDVEPFNFPYCSRFPSGIDGDQMAQLYGYLYQRSLHAAFRRRGRRTWGDVRATTALAAPLPFCLYSDAYEFGEYLRQLVNASFAGLLWSPEVRDAATVGELLNRVGMAALAPQMCLNLWFMPHPVWEQYDAAKNQAHELLPAPEQEFLLGRLREIARQRMALLPYLYSCFFRYWDAGLPPVRALVLEFPDDPHVRAIDDQYLFGDLLMAAPLVGAAARRAVRFPAACDWFDFRTGARHAAGSLAEVCSRPGDVPLFVRDQCLLPVAAPVGCVTAETVFELTVRVYGTQPQPFVLYEDDGETDAHERGESNRVELSWAAGEGCVRRRGGFGGARYRIAGWERMDRGTS